MEQPSETLASTSDAQNDSFSCRNDTGRGSIAERRAAKCGFKADRINTPRFRSVSPLTSPAAARSPFITIPPGVSPTALLDSPVMLPNCQPSPTTGSFPFPLMNYGGSVMNTHSGVVDNGASDAGSFEFKPYNCVALSEHQANNTPAFQQVGSVEPSLDFEFSLDLSKGTATDSFAKDAAITGAISSISKVQIGDTDVSSNQRSLPMESTLGENIETHHLEEEKGTLSATGTSRNSEDGYNWRKYGQKQVKGSEYPRSYYKCTHSNCLVKKKIERSHDGQITEIIYKGAHNHPKPQPNRRAQVGSTSAFDDALEMNEASETSARVDVGSVWNNLQPGSKDGLERTPSTSIVTELSDPLSITQGKCMQTFESVGAQELSSRFVCNDDVEDDRATQGSVSLGVDADFEEPESKRRKIDSCTVETNLSSRAVREPRVVVQIESEVDILDDGYRWRKYGQKVVKGNPNPRSYYKCTSAGCSVRKHVERASHNLKFVITTYEGKHNHEVPAAKNSNNLNSNGSSLPHTNAQPASTYARNSNTIKSEAQIQDYAPGFDRKPAFNIGYLRPSFPGNFSDEMKLGASSTYPLKYPPFHPTVSCGSSEFNNLGSVHHSGSIASYVPDFQISLPSSLHKSSNPSLDGVAFNCNNGKPANQRQLFMSGQQLVLPKLEQRDDDHFDAGKATIDHVNGSLSSSVYQGIMGNFTS